jgi:hypothetical protein
MGTYFALMDEAAKHGGDYQDLDHFREILLNVQKGQASPDEINNVLASLEAWTTRIATLKQDHPSMAEQAQKALDRLVVLQSALKASLSVARR